MPVYIFIWRGIVFMDWHSTNIQTQYNKPTQNKTVYSRFAQINPNIYVSFGILAMFAIKTWQPTFTLCSAHHCKSKRTPVGVVV